MLKNAYLSLAFALLSCAPIAYASENISQAIKDIMLEVKTALILKDKAEKHFQDILSDTYETTKQRCLAVLKIIASSPEFASTIEQVTDEQARLIAKEMVKYNDIIIDPSAFPLEQKVEAELSLAAFNNQEEQLFNIFYVVFAIIHGSKILVNKLKLIEKEYNFEHAAVNPTDHVSQA
jgi:hypothetical protein